MEAIEKSSVEQLSLLVFHKEGEKNHGHTSLTSEWLSLLGKPRYVPGGPGCALVTAGPAAPGVTVWVTPAQTGCRLI